MDDLRANFRTNVEGAIFTVQYLRPLLESGQAKQIFLISSIVGSMQGFYSQLSAGVSCAYFSGSFPPARRRSADSLLSTIDSMSKVCSLDPQTPLKQRRKSTID
jgi:NAD(P)-dependent dehydrogenase (short-subunit alcohol dehydrogenase family)